MVRPTRPKLGRDGNMKAGIARTGRTTLAALLAAGLVASLLFVIAEPPALANHVPPDDIVEQVQGSNGADYWEDYLLEVRGIDGTCWKIEEAADTAWVMPQEPAGEDWVLLVVKQATTNYVYYDPVAGHTYPATGNQGPGYSHIMVCSVEESTTTTAPPTTSPPTTAPPTTSPPTTAPPTTAPPTTAPPTTSPPTTSPPTTAPPTTAPPTTIPPDEVLAAIVVTIEGVCEVNDNDEGEGIIEVDMSVEGGAQVVIRDSDGDVIDTRSTSGTVTVPEGATYTWEASPNEGFEFPAGSETSGSITIETCSEAETLPFTGVNTEWLAVLASALLAAGLTLVGATRRHEEA